MLKGRNIVVVSTINWDFLWQGHQAISTILARAGNRVLFIENTGVRSPSWADRARVVDRLRKWSSGRGRFAPVENDIFLYSPLALPFPYSAWAQSLNRRWIGSKISRWLRTHAFDDPILISFLPTQFALDLIDEIRPAASVFCCNDRLSKTSFGARHLVPYEKRFVERCDLVFASAEKLLEYCLPFNPETRLLSTGVSIEKFDAAWRGECSMPARLAKLRRPIIGHVGGMRKCVDQQLLQAVSRQLPQATFVLVGPEQISIQSLKELPNVEFVGPLPHEDVPAYVRGFDVCLIPYVVDDFTDHISPAKLNEYLAVGKPVVSTPLFEVCRFAERYAGIVAVADGPDEFVTAIEAALRDDSAERREQRRKVAESQSWVLKVEEMSRSIETVLAARPPHRAARSDA